MSPVFRGTHIFNPYRPMPHMPSLDGDEPGVTICDFQCTAVIDGQIVRASRQGDATVAAIQVEAVHFVLGAKIDEWLAYAAGNKILAHEDGHAIIGEHFYDHGGVVAQRIGAELIGHDFYGAGTDRDAAVQDALGVAAQQAARQYLIHLRNPCDRVQQAYDAITQHGTNSVDEIDAIERAMNDPAVREEFVDSQ